MKEKFELPDSSFLDHHQKMKRQQKKMRILTKSF